MDKKIARKWVTDLRSGKFEQRVESLCRFNSYCCLGVLSVAIADDPRVQSTGYRWEIDGSGRGFWSRVDDGVDPAMYGELPTPVLSAIEMPHGDQGQFINMNDDEYKSFAEIADENERRYLKG